MPKWNLPWGRCLPFPSSVPRKLSDNALADNAYIAVENPRWWGGGQGRVEGIGDVEYDKDDDELHRRYQGFCGNPYYPGMAELQRLVSDINQGESNVAESVATSGKTVLTTYARPGQLRS